MNWPHCPARLIALLTLLLASGSLLACKRPGPPVPGAQEPQKALMTPPAFSTYTPQEPFRQLAPGLLARTAYVAEKGGRYGIEMWDLLVGPGKKSGAATLPGAAMFEVRSGRGTVTVSGKPREVQMGATFSLDEGAEFIIENRSPDVGMAIRVTLIHRP